MITTESSWFIVDNLGNLVARRQHDVHQHRGREIISKRNEKSIASI